MTSGSWSSASAPILVASRLPINATMAPGSARAMARNTIPRVRGTVKAIEQRLLVEGFVLRYNSEVTEDGLPAGEGAFLACSFWLADNFVLLGRDDDARKLFERLLAVRNDVGLLAEEYNPRSRRQLGNFPQAFSHVALADTARNLTEAAKPARQRSAP